MTVADIRQALHRVLDGQDLEREEMRVVMQQVMTGQASDAQIGAFLVALRLKGESLDEITGAVDVMRELATGVQVDGEHVVDIVGTGGDGANLFNISTAACFVVAAAGGRVAKHGNRSVSSQSGSADLLEAAGVRLDLSPEQVTLCIDEVGVGFMFAPAHHSAMKHAIGPRRELGIRTLFNILGPMTNPAGVKNQLIGVYDASLCRPMAEVLGRLGGHHVMVVHADDGLDELSIVSPTQVAELRNGAIREWALEPRTLGIEHDDLDGLSVKDAAESLQLVRLALAAEKPKTERAAKARDILALNAGAALYVAGLATAVAEGHGQALALIESGEALARLERLAEFSQSLD